MFVMGERKGFSWKKFVFVFILTVVVIRIPSKFEHSRVKVMTLKKKHVHSGKKCNGGKKGEQINSLQESWWSDSMKIMKTKSVIFGSFDKIIIAIWRHNPRSGWSIQNEVYDRTEKYWFFFLFLFLFFLNIYLFSDPKALQIRRTIFCLVFFFISFLHNLKIFVWSSKIKLWNFHLLII